jgi:hypothetical protein
MNRTLSLFCIICLSSLSAQWTNFDLNDTPPAEFESTVLPLFNQGALIVGFNPFLSPASNRRLHTGLVLANGMDLTRGNSSLKWFPAFHGSLWVTPNLTVRGKIGDITTGSTLLQLWGFGLSLRPEAKKTESFWELSADVGRLEVVEQYYLNSYTFAVRRVFSVKTVPVFVSLQSNQFKVRFNQSVNPAFPQKMGRKLAYVNIGALFRFRGVSLVPQITGNTKFVSIFMDFNLEFN